jgi:hypothetical protein
VTWVTFEARVAPMVWGRSTYTVLPLPDDIVAVLCPTRRVEGEINDHPVNLSITRAPVVPFAFLWAGQSLLDRIGVAPGDRLDVRLRPAPDDLVETPPDLVQALTAAGVLAGWLALTPGRRRSDLYGIDSARRPDTRARRILSLAASHAGRG